MSINRIPVLKRLVPSVRKRVVPLLWPRGWRVTELHGALFLVNYFSFTDRVIGFDRRWERQQIEYLCKGIARYGAEVFFDIGAYGGLYAILVAQEKLCERIVAFEPDPNCRQRLYANLHLNNMTDRIEVREEALSDRSGRLPFFRETTFGGGKSRIVPTSDFSVPCARLDDLFDFRAKNIALKIDVEYHEIEVLSGMKSLLQNNACFFQIECPDDHLPSAMEQLGPLGYRLMHSIGHDRYFTNH